MFLTPVEGPTEAVFSGALIIVSAEVKMQVRRRAAYNRLPLCYVWGSDGVNVSADAIKVIERKGCIVNRKWASTRHGRWYWANSIM